VQELTRFRKWQSNQKDAIGMKKPDLLRRVTAVDRPPIRRCVCTGTMDDLNFRRHLFNALLKPVGVEVYCSFNFLIHCVSLLSFPLCTEFCAVGRGLGIATSDAGRLGTLDLAAARASAGELKNVAEYPCLLSVLATEEANDMFNHRVRYLRNFVPSAHPLLVNFAHMWELSILMVNRRRRGDSLGWHTLPDPGHGHKRKEPAAIHTGEITRQDFLAQCIPKIEAAVGA
jgi:hypothetical protein